MVDGVLPNLEAQTCIFCDTQISKEQKTGKGDPARWPGIPKSGTGTALYGRGQLGSICVKK